MATIDEQITALDVQIASASQAVNVRDGDKSVTRQTLADLQALRAQLVNRKALSTRRSRVTYIEMSED